MKILARHLTVDLFNCKNSKLKDIDQIKAYTTELPGHFALTKISECSEHLTEDHYAIMMLFREGHMVLHIYTCLLYTSDAADE